MRKVYLDTSVISALFDERTPERMAQTSQMWTLLDDYEVCISSLVELELSNTTKPFMSRLLEAVENFTVLEINDDVYKLADIYVEKEIFSEKYYDDAVHVAVASINNVGILLSWNFAHLVKMKTRRMVALVNSEKNYLPVEIIAPPEL